MNLEMMFRSDVEYVDEDDLRNRRNVYLYDYDYRDKIVYCEKTDTCGPCLVCDIGDFNNLIRSEKEFKFSEHEHRFYGNAKFKIKIFPHKKLSRATEWVISQLKHLEPFHDCDELGRTDFDYTLAIDKAEKFPSKAYALNGKEIYFHRQYDINRLILEDGCRPTYPEVRALDRVYNKLKGMYY